MSKTSKGNVNELDLMEFYKERTYINDIKSGKVEVAGWVHDKRDLGNKILEQIKKYE